MSERDPLYARIQNIPVRDILQKATKAHTITDQEAKYLESYKEACRLNIEHKQERDILELKTGLAKIFSQKHLDELNLQLRKEGEILYQFENSDVLQPVINRVRSEEFNKQDDERSKRFDEELREKAIEHEKRVVEEYQRKRSALNIRRVQRNQFAELMDCSSSNLSLVENLAVETLMSIYKLNDEINSPIMSSSNLLCCDSIVFACFFIRALCIGEISNRYAAEEFSNEYVRLVIKATKGKYMPSGYIFNELFDNRTSLYDEVFTQDISFNEKLSMLNGYFKNIIELDYTEPTYKLIESGSTIPSISMEKDIRIQQEIIAYHSIIASLIKNNISEIRKYYGN